MGTGIVGLRLTEKRGKLIVQALGRTQRGTRYLKDEVVLDNESTAEDSFRDNVRSAAIELHDRNVK